MNLYRRQKLLLTLLDAAGGELGAVDLQKLLFLFVQKNKSEPTYQFLPHRFGSYSFQAAYDREVLINKGCLVDGDQNGWKIAPKAKSFLQESLQAPMKFFVTKMVPERGQELITKVYREFPYFAIRSEILDQVFPHGSERTAIDKAQNRETEKALLTIGYEGDSIDGYLNRLIQNNVRLLCDVRKNPLSRKTGFSKRALERYCGKVDIVYKHIPDLGIPGSLRRELKTPADYEKLFDEYRTEMLPFAGEALNEVEELIEKYSRVALTCFEKKHTECHRHCVAEELQRRSNRCPTVLNI